MYDIVRSTIEDLNPEGVVFYGASMGGYAAMRIGGLFPQHLVSFLDLKFHCICQDPQPKTCNN